MIPIVLYTKANCTLCDQAKVLLAGFHGRYPYELREVDITADDALFALYRYRIPVLDIAGREVAAPIEASALEEALRLAWDEGVLG